MREYRPSGQACSRLTTTNAPTIARLRSPGDCDLADAAKTYATKCILNEHGSSAENMADMWKFDNSYPAGTDEEAYEAVWGCERTEFQFDQPEIVCGFKADCHTGANGGKPVNGHWTQVVWRSNTAVGCGRAKCSMTDKNGVVHQGTHWVCRYSPGGNDPGALAQNVQQPPCKNAFHSLTVPSCSAGMVLTASGTCACPTGERWNGRMCASGPNLTPSRQHCPYVPVGIAALSILSPYRPISRLLPCRDRVPRRRVSPAKRIGRSNALAFRR